MSSFERINYSVRPGKHIERKLIVEALMRLGVLVPINAYQYVGMGSTFFTDFRLVHRLLGITDMFSIEREERKRDRFDFNRPYECVTMAYGESSAVLPELDLERPSIIWLDYDGRLVRYMLEDLDIVAERAPHGSVLLITVNAQPGSGDRLADLRQRVGEENVPADVTDSTHLAGSKTAEVYSTIVNRRLRGVVEERNNVLADDERLEVKTLFHFRYRDGAPMLTLGWLLHKQPGDIIDALFDGLSQVPEDGEPYEIEVPSLTAKERRHLDERLPTDDPAEGALFIPEDDRRKYARVYRHFPVYADVDLG